MANLIVDNAAFSGKNASSAVEVYNWTVTKSGKFQFKVRLTNAAGNGNYTAYLTYQRGGAGTVFPLVPKATYAAATGESAFGFVSGLLEFSQGDKVGINILGLAGDASPGLSGNVDVTEDDALVPVVAGQNATLVAASGKVDVNDKTGFSLSAAGILALWNQLTADGGILANTFAAKLRDWVLGTDKKALISTDVQDLSATFDVNAKLLAGAVPNNLAAGAQMDLVNSPNAVAVVAISTKVNADLTSIHGAGPYGGAAGTGFYTVVIPCAVNAVPADGVEVRVTNDSDGLNRVAQALSDTNGNATVYLDAGTYYVFLERGGDDFPNPTEITVP